MLGLPVKPLAMLMKIPTLFRLGLVLALLIVGVFLNAFSMVFSSSLGVCRYALGLD